MNKSLEERKKAIIRKFYGGKRKPYYHNFDENTGICSECNTFIGDATMKLCKVITKDEVALFNSNYYE